MLSAMINTLSCFYPEAQDMDEEGFFEEAARLVSKVRTIAAYSHRRSLGRPFMYPDPKLPYVANFLHMMFSMPFDQHVASQEVVEAFNLILLLHADHEQNCSTSTVRVVGSSRANLFASCAAGARTPWGASQRGRNVAVLDMLESASTREACSAEQTLDLANDKKRGFKLMGFGHRVYKNFDPRAVILKRSADKVLSQLGVNDPLLDIARRLEELALTDSYFVERKLYPNVDFYSGILMRAMGVPTNMFTVIFAIGRMPGWIAHWKEQHDSEGGRIARPRQIYTGPQEMKYTPSSWSDRIVVLSQRLRFPAYDQSRLGPTSADGLNAVSAVPKGRRRPLGQAKRDREVPMSVNGKVCLVTGATSGIGAIDHAAAGKSPSKGRRSSTSGAASNVARTDREADPGRRRATPSVEFPCADLSEPGRGPPAGRGDPRTLSEDRRLAE